jgi:tetratricopeptide (TPR) repeat protein
MPTLGLAMIVRNGAGTMRLALNPLLDYVNEISIVLGGWSEDNTADIASEYANHLDQYTGLLHPDGYLMDFSEARNQAIAALGTDWVIVVDADDQWQGAENIPDLIEMAGQNGAAMIAVPYGMLASKFYQARFFRIGSGEYRGPVHEAWHLRDTSTGQAKTEMVSVTQVRNAAWNEPRVRQNIAIGERHLAEVGEEPRTLSNLMQDYSALEEWRQVIGLGIRYLAAYKQREDYDKPDQLFYVHFMVGLASLFINHYRQAFDAALQAINTRNYGQGWVLLAEAAHQMSFAAAEPDGLNRLAIMAADEALAIGQQTTVVPLVADHVQVLPWHVKGKALHELGRHKESLTAVEMGLRLDPANKPIRQTYNAILASQE